MTIDNLEAEIVQLRRRLSAAETARRALEQAAAADRETLRRLAELSRYCADRSHEVADCLQRILEAAIATTGADKGNIQLLDAQSGALTIAAQRGFEALFLEFFANVRSDDVAACGAAMAASQRIIVEDVTKSELFAGQPSLQVLLDAGVRAVQATPLTSSGGRVVGMISTHFSAPRRMGEAELRWMDLLARQAADYLVRVQAEHAERESRQQLAVEEARARLAAIVDSADDAIVSKDLNGVIRSWNRGAERIFGWTAAEAVGRHISLIIPEERRTEADDILTHIRRGQSVERIETVRVTKDGEHLDISLTVSPVRDRADRIVGASKIARDVTDRRRLEAERDRLLAETQASHRELQDREAKIRRLVDANIIGIFLWDYDGRILEANDAFLDMIGYDRDDLAAGRIRWTDLTPLDWRELTDEKMREHRMGMYRGSFEKDYLRKDGSRVPVVLGCTSFDEEGSQGGVAWVLDLTERKRADQRRLAQHSVTRILTEAATVEEAVPRILQAVCEQLGWDLGAFWRSDRQAGALRCAAIWRAESLKAPDFETATREMSFAPGIGLPGRVWQSREATYISDLADDPGFLRTSNAAAAGLRSAFAFPIGVVDKVLGVMDFLSRERRPPDADLLTLMTAIGNQVGQFIERKRAEGAVRQAEAELAHVTRVTTLGELAASIAHEVNQPLAAIVADGTASLNWLRAEPPDLDRVRDALDAIVTDGYRAAEVIQRVRQLATKTAPQNDRLDVNDLVRDVVPLVRSELSRYDVAFAAELASPLPPVLGDRIQLQQVMLNLVMNAIDAMAAVADRPRELVIRSQPDRAHVEIAVHDTGVGIDPDHLDRLFDAFFTTKRDGLGMGLSISRSIVEAHSGRLWATPNEPHGAIFHVSLPCAR